MQDFLQTKASEAATGSPVNLSPQEEKEDSNAVVHALIDQIIDIFKSTNSTGEFKEFCKNFKLPAWFIELLNLSKQLYKEPRKEDDKQKLLKKRITKLIGKNPQLSHLTESQVWAIFSKIWDRWEEKGEVALYLDALYSGSPNRISAYFSKKIASDEEHKMTLSLKESLQLLGDVLGPENPFQREGISQLDAIRQEYMGVAYQLDFVLPEDDTESKRWQEERKIQTYFEHVKEGYAERNKIFVEFINQVEKEPYRFIPLFEQRVEKDPKLKALGWKAFYEEMQDLWLQIKIEHDILYLVACVEVHVREHSIQGRHHNDVASCIGPDIQEAHSRITFTTEQQYRKSVEKILQDMDNIHSFAGQLVKCIFTAEKLDSPIPEMDGKQYFGSLVVKYLARLERNTLNFTATIRTGLDADQESATALIEEIKADRESRVALIEKTQFRVQEQLPAPIEWIVPDILPGLIQKVINLPNLLPSKEKKQSASHIKPKKLEGFYTRLESILSLAFELNKKEMGGALPKDQTELNKAIEKLCDLLENYEKQNKKKLENPLVLKNLYSLLNITLLLVGFCISAEKRTAGEIDLIKQYDALSKKHQEKTLYLRSIMQGPGDCQSLIKAGWGFIFEQTPLLQEIAEKAKAVEQMQIPEQDIAAAKESGSLPACISYQAPEVLSARGIWEKMLINKDYAEAKKTCDHLSKAAEAVNDLQTQFEGRFTYVEIGLAELQAMHKKPIEEIKNGELRAASNALLAQHDKTREILKRYTNQHEEGSAEKLDIQKLQMMTAAAETIFETLIEKTKLVLKRAEFKRTLLENTRFELEVEKKELETSRALAIKRVGGIEKWRAGKASVGELSTPARRLQEVNRRLKKINGELNGELHDIPAFSSSFEKREAAIRGNLNTLKRRQQDVIEGRVRPPKYQTKSDKKQVPPGMPSPAEPVEKEEEKIATESGSPFSQNREPKPTQPPHQEKLERVNVVQKSPTPAGLKPKRTQGEKALVGKQSQHPPMQTLTPSAPSGKKSKQKKGQDVPGPRSDASTPSQTQIRILQRPSSAQPFGTDAGFFHPPQGVSENREGNTRESGLGGDSERKASARNQHPASTVPVPQPVSPPIDSQQAAPQAVPALEPFNPPPFQRLPHPSLLHPSEFFQPPPAYSPFMRLPLQRSLVGPHARLQIPSVNPFMPPSHGHFLVPPHVRLHQNFQPPSSGASVGFFPPPPEGEDWSCLFEDAPEELEVMKVLAAEHGWSALGGGDLRSRICRMLGIPGDIESSDCDMFTYGDRPTVLQKLQQCPGLTRPCENPDNARLLNASFLKNNKRLDTMCYPELPPDNRDGRLFKALKKWMHEGDKGLTDQAQKVEAAQERKVDGRVRFTPHRLALFYSEGRLRLMDMWSGQEIKSRQELMARSDIGGKMLTTTHPPEEIEYNPILLLKGVKMMLVEGYTQLHPSLKKWIKSSGAETLSSAIQDPYHFQQKRLLRHIDRELKPVLRKISPENHQAACDLLKELNLLKVDALQQCMLSTKPASSLLAAGAGLI